MDSRQENIADAAIRVFSRYGVRRTTMNDIAEEAGIVRQTLYNVYANKDDVLQAVIRRVTDVALKAIREDCDGVTDLGAQLDIVFDHLVIRFFRLMQNMPDVEDIDSGFNAAGREEMARADERSRQLIEGLLVPYSDAIEASGLSPALLADFIRTASTGFKHSASSEPHLLELLHALKVQALAITGAAHA